VSDFPAPVGMTPMQSRPASTVSMIFSCPGRKSSKPKTPVRTSRGVVERGRRGSWSMRSYSRQTDAIQPA